jgi:4-carboxymuconolactone decarboxylase
VNDEDRVKQGMRVRREVLGDEHVDRAAATTTSFTEPFQDFITRYAWGDVWSRPGLTRPERSIVTLTALAALGREHELGMHVKAALRNGLTPDQIAEILLQVAVYAGVPAANRAFAVAQQALRDAGTGVDAGELRAGSGVIQEYDGGPMNPGDYLAAMKETGLYAMSRGGPLIVRRYHSFLRGFVKAWLRGPKVTEDEITQALFGGWPLWVQASVRKRIVDNPKAGQVLIRLQILAAVMFFLPADLAKSVLLSIYDVVRKGLRGLPPLIVAVAVIFVTSDAWQLFGHGLTGRFYAMISLVLLVTFAFVARWNPWPDLCVGQVEAAQLLAGVRHGHPRKLSEFTRRGLRGAPIVPMSRPSGWRVRVNYWVVLLFALIATAGLVAAALVIVGVILISRADTLDLAKSIYVYQTFPHGLIVTQQLISISLSLGAFAPLFLVAAQRQEDRAEFITTLLTRYRRALLAYSVYVRACESARELTTIAISPDGT